MTAPRLRPNEVEAANRAEATALLIRVGYRVYYPVADVEGEDLVVRTPHGELLAVQLKARPTVDWPRYGDRSLWMLFPNPEAKERREWFLIPHDELFGWVKLRHGHTAGWSDTWVYPHISKELQAFLGRYLIGA